MAIVPGRVRAERRRRRPLSNATLQEKVSRTKTKEEMVRKYNRMDWEDLHGSYEAMVIFLYALLR